MSNSHIVIFDGVCNFCNWAVNFIIKRDPEAKFLFTPMQSELAKDLMLKYQADNVGVELPPIMWTPLNNLKVLQCPSIITPEKHGFTQMNLKSKPLN